MFNKKVTVLMPVCNGEKYIKRAIDSLLNQSYKEAYDILIIDDGSTDDTVSIVKSYHSDKIYLLQNEKNIRIAATLNKGLDLITGEYIVRMDADDISHHDRLKMQIDFMDQNKNIAVCGTEYSADPTLFNKKGNRWSKHREGANMFLYRPDVLRSILPFAFVLNHSTVVFRNRILREKGYRYSTEVGYIEDYDLWLRMVYHEEFFILPYRLLAYRRHGQAMSFTALPVRIKMLETVFSRFFREYDINCTEAELYRFCYIRAKIMHNEPINDSERYEFFEFIKQKFYCSDKLARHINPDYLRYVLKSF